MCSDVNVLNTETANIILMPMMENYINNEQIIDYETMSDEELLNNHVIVDDNDLKELDNMLSSYFSKIKIS